MQLHKFLQTQKNCNYVIYLHFHVRFQCLIKQHNTKNCLIVITTNVNQFEIVQVKQLKFNSGKKHLSFN